MTEWLDIIDRADVPTLFIVCVYGFWYLHKQITAVQTTQAVQTEALSLLVQQVKEHAAHDADEHRRLYDKIEAARDVATNDA